MGLRILSPLTKVPLVESRSSTTTDPPERRSTGRVSADLDVGWYKAGAPSVRDPSLALYEREAAAQDFGYFSDPDGYFSKVASS